MYLAHFGMSEAPFTITPDTAFFFPFSRYQSALNTLLIAAQEGEGFIKVVGEVGTGKTLLCRKFLSLMGDDFVTALMPNPYLEPRTLLLALADELNITLADSTDQHHLLKAITDALLGFARQGKRVLLCLDEAQAMPIESLEAIRLLSNLETEKRKLMQVVLFGQPELDDKLNEPSIRQLKQRIVFEARLTPLSHDELPVYLNARLGSAGYMGDTLFDRRAVSLMYGASGGVPRLVNLLAHKALILTFGRGELKVGRMQMQMAIRDTPAAHIPWQFRFRPAFWLG